MPGILTPILRPLRRWTSTASTGPRPEPLRLGSRQLARRLADAIDRALALGLWDHAERLARTAAPLASGYARLAEPLARLRLAQGDAETALSIIDTCRTPPASLRMLRAVCLLSLGARAEANIDLLRWSAKASAPIDARLLLGLLDRHGDDTAAIQVLQRNLKHLEDPRTIQALLLLSVQRGRREQAETWAARLQGCCTESWGPEADLMLQSLGMSGIRADAEPTPEQVNALTMELITFEPAIETLVEAQRRRLHVPTARLLRRAIEQALPDLADPAAALHAMARLSLQLGDQTAARAFAERGLAANPMSAPLALLLQELGDPTPPEPAAVSPHPTDHDVPLEKAA